MIKKERTGFDRSVFTMKWFFTLFGYVFSVEQVSNSNPVFMDVESYTAGGLQGDPRSHFGIAVLSPGRGKLLSSSSSRRTSTLLITSLASTTPASL